jgi:hypothetical protein
LVKARVTADSKTSGIRYEKNMSLTQTNRASDEELLACIDRGLDKVGPNVKHLVFWHLDRVSHIRRADIPENPEKFLEGLRSLYRASAPAVERAILQEINSNFELHYSQNQLGKAMSEARLKQIA